MSSSHFGRLKPSMEGSIQISRDLCWLYLQVMEMFILPYALPLQCYTGSSLLVYISIKSKENNEAYSAQFTNPED